MSWRPKTAFVLAAGLGTRMQPLTDLVPKPLVQLDGKALIDHVLDRIAEAGIETAIVNVHHHADQLEAHLARRTRPRIVLSDERRRLLDTGGGIACALSRLGPEPFLIHNSDSVWIEGVGSTLARLFRAWDGTKIDSLMLLATGASSLGYDGHGDFTMAPDGLLARRSEHREAPFVFTGVSIAHPRLFAGAPDGRFSLNVLWDRAIERGRLYGIRLDGTWMHVGTPEALEEAKRRMQGEVTG
jgi:MurNAc alpha-1-phosphate uridylyltransferase